MWEHEHSVVADVTPEAVWRIWSDIDDLPAWNGGIESIELHGPFATGTEFTMKPPGREAVAMRLAAVVENELLTEEVQLEGLVIQVIHRLERLPAGRTEITYRTEITGPAADELGPHVGPGITASVPETVARLVERATASSGGARP